MGGHILLTGATGNTGSVVADLLQKRGIEFVAMVRGEASRKKLEARGIRTVYGDFDDPKSLTTALVNTEKAYLVCTPDQGLIPRETAFIAAAKDAGVRHIIKCSAYMADVESESRNLRAHGIIERALAESGVAWTVIRPHGFMQTFTLFSWDLIRRVGVVSAPHGDGGMALVDVRDVAEVAVKALTEEGHEGRCYDVTGPESLDMWDLAGTLERVLDRPVSYLPGDERAMQRVMKLLGVPEVPTQHVLTISRMVRERKLETVHSTLRDLGIEPRTYETFVRDLVAGRTGGGNSFQPPNAITAKALGVIGALMMGLRLAFFGRPRNPKKSAL